MLRRRSRWQWILPVLMLALVPAALVADEEGEGLVFVCPKDAPYRLEAVDRSVKAEANKPIQVRVRLVMPLVRVPQGWRRIGVEKQITGKEGETGASIEAGQGSKVADDVRASMDERKGELRSAATADEKALDRDRLLSYGCIVYNGRQARSFAQDLRKHFKPVIASPRDAPNIRIQSTVSGDKGDYEVTDENMRRHGRFMFDAVKVTDPNDIEAVMVEVTAAWVLKLTVDPASPGAGIFLDVRFSPPPADANDDGGPPQASSVLPGLFFSDVSLSMSMLQGRPRDYTDLEFIGGFAVQDNNQGGLLGFNASMAYKEGRPWYSPTRVGLLAGRSIGPGAAYLLAGSYRIGERSYAYYGRAFGAGNGTTRESQAFGLAFRMNDILNPTLTGGTRGAADSDKVPVRVVNAPAPAAPAAVSGDYAVVHLRGLGFVEDKVIPSTAWDRGPAPQKPRERAFVQFVRETQPPASGTGGIVLWDLGDRLTKLWDLVYTGHPTWTSQRWQVAERGDTDCVIFEPEGAITGLRVVVGEDDSAGKLRAAHAWDRGAGDLDVKILEPDGKLKDPANGTITLKRGEATCIVVSLKAAPAE